MENAISLTAREVYARFAESPRSTSGVVAQCLELEAETIEAAVGELADVGLIAPSQVNRGEWRVVHPATAMGGPLSEAEATAAEALRRVSRLRTDMAALATTFATTEMPRAAMDTSAFELLPDRDAVLRRMDLVAERTTQRLWAFVTRRPSVTAVNGSRAADEAMLQRGVSIRTLCLDAFLRDARLVAAMRAKSEAGAEVRTTAALPARVVVMDGHAFVALDPADPGAGAVVTTSEGLVATLTDHFEHRWSHASRLPSASPEAAGSTGATSRITETELVLLKMLAEGHKDERMARTVKLSVRTVRRIIADLSAQVEAQSRFQLALLARDRGWI